MWGCSRTCELHLVGRSDVLQHPHINHEYEIIMRFAVLLICSALGLNCHAYERVSELPEVVVTPKDREVLHILAYVRECSRLTTYSDTVTLFREKTVDFMLPARKVKRFKGWSLPRLLSSQSYYRFTNSAGLDSVSDSFTTHFSWSDWIGVPKGIGMSEKCRESESATDTVRGRMEVSRIWNRDAEHVDLWLNVLADTLNRAWVPMLSVFNKRDSEFNNLNIRYIYDDVISDTLTAEQLTGITFYIESCGRKYNLPRTFINRTNPNVETFAEMYIIDKEYISLSDARKLEKKPPEDMIASARRPKDMPAFPIDAAALIARVDNIDRDLIRRKIIPDQRLAGFKDLFKTRRSTWQQLWELISPPRYSINATTLPGR